MLIDYKKDVSLSVSYGNYYIILIGQGKVNHFISGTLGLSSRTASVQSVKDFTKMFVQLETDQSTCMNPYMIDSKRQYLSTIDVDNYCGMNMLGKGVTISDLLEYFYIEGNYSYEIDTIAL